MIEYIIRSENGAEVRGWLKKGENLDEPIGKAMTGWATDLLDGQLYGMENYAPPPPNSRYVRTGRLGANWGLQRQGKTGIRFYNMTAYAGYVVGEGDGKGQAWMHAARWWLGRKKIEADLPRAQKAIEREIKRALR